jgi:invasion protein IalB
VGDKNVPHPPQTAPVITTQPHIKYVKSGNTATFTVVASNSWSLHYQWKKNGANVGCDAAGHTTRQRPRFDLEYNL